MNHVTALIMVRDPPTGIATGRAPGHLGVDGTTVTRLVDVMIVLLAAMAMIRLLADIWKMTAEAEPQITDREAPHVAATARNLLLTGTPKSSGLILTKAFPQEPSKVRFLLDVVGRPIY